MAARPTRQAHPSLASQLLVPNNQVAAIYEHLIAEELARHLEAETGIAGLIEPLDDADLAILALRRRLVCPVWCSQGD